MAGKTPVTHHDPQTNFSAQKKNTCGAGKKIRDLNGETEESFYTKLPFPKPTLKPK